ncbi:unnamed protein product [Closterium sp. Yama58-4]|nr:unnamed protein product [Closterium sp. Yama58-4]
MAGAGQARLTAGGRNLMGTAAKSRVQARLFGPAVFESKKLQVVFMGAKEEQHPAHAPLPRMYTFTHSDVTAGLTLAIAHEFNKSQFMGWYSRLQRDEVLAVWRQHCSLADFRSPYLRDPWQEVHPEHACNGSDCHMSLHVHCHISGGHFLLNAIAALRFWIFRKELPVVLEAFRHGDRALFDKHPDLEDALVWVHFHSNIPEYNRHECWGHLHSAAQTGAEKTQSQLSYGAQRVVEAISTAAEREHQWPVEERRVAMAGFEIPPPPYEGESN